MLTTRRAIALCAALCAAAFAASLAFWNSLPDLMATHWNAQGVADGTSSKAFGAFFLPALAAGVAALMFWLPRIDPLASGFKAFRKEYDGLVALIVGFLLLMHGVVLAWNLGARFEIVRFVGPGIGLLFWYLGAVMPQMKRNWFAGIRTPWTLSSVRVWEEAHRVGGTLFRVSGALAVLGGVFTAYAIPLIVVPALASALGVTVYSYLVYRKGA